MSGVNKVIILGRLGKDPETKTLDNGVMVANFSVATSETWKDKTTGEKKESTEWHNVVLWRGLAEIASKYLKKGDLVYIEGKLTTRSWEKDGVTRYTTEIVGNDMTLLSPKSSGGSQNQAPPPTSEPQGRSGASQAPGAQSGSNGSQGFKQEAPPPAKVNPNIDKLPWES